LQRQQVENGKHKERLDQAKAAAGVRGQGGLVVYILRGEDMAKARAAGWLLNTKFGRLVAGGLNMWVSECVWLGQEHVRSCCMQSHSHNLRY
jgi:hypothetical protein